jgi:hypothetical protein
MFEPSFAMFESSCLASNSYCFTDAMSPIFCSIYSWKCIWEPVFYISATSSVPLHLYGTYLINLLHLALQHDKNETLRVHLETGVLYLSYIKCTTSPICHLISDQSSICIWRFNMTKLNFESASGDRMYTSATSSIHLHLYTTYLGSESIWHSSLTKPHLRVHR